MSFEKTIGSQSLPTKRTSAFRGSLSSNWLCWLFAYFAACFVVALCSFNFVLLYSSHLCGKSSLALVACFALAVGLLFLCLLKSWKGSPERVFLLVAFPAGLLFALFLIPGQVPDEYVHIYRACDLKLTGAGTTVPAILANMPTNYSDYREMLFSAANWADTVSDSRDLTNYYIHLYLLPNLAIRLCCLLGANPYFAVIVGKLINGAVFCILGYWIVKKVPLGKVLGCIYLLNPMLIQQEFSLSADAMVNAISLSFVAYILYLKFAESISKKNIAWLVLLLVLTCVSKFAYAPLALLLLLLVPRLGSKRVRRAIYFGSVGIVALGVVLVIAFYQGTTYALAFELVRDPKEFLFVMFNSTVELGPLWIKEFSGMVLGSLNITVWEPCFWAYGLMLLFAAVFNLGESESLVRWEKVFVVVLTAFVSVAILLVFREWTITVDQRSDVIMGMQGRYLLPFYILPLLALVTPRASQVRANCMVLYGCSLAIVYLADACCIVSRFMF